MPLTRVTDKQVTYKQPGGILRNLFDTMQGFVTVKGFGAVGDWNGTTGADDTAAIQLAIDYAAANRVKLRITAGRYRVVGVLKTRSNLHLEFDNDAWICPTAWNVYGGVLTNVAENPIQSNVFIENPQFDGQWLPTDELGNSNAMGFANGASFFRVNGGYIKNFAFSWSTGGAGGKAVNYESGVTDSMITNLSAENCGVAVFVQGEDGADNGSTRIIISNIIAKNCEAAVAVLGIREAADPDGDPADSLVIIDGVTFYNCGHAPSRPVTTNFEKSGVIVLGEAQNVRISNVKGYNDPGYPASWPPAGSGVIGEGLSGPIGAVVWGWGRNITVEGVEYHGNCDSLIKINRARAIGEDAPPDGIPENVFRFDVDGLRHYGTTSYILDRQTNITSANVTGTMLNIFPDVVSLGFMSPAMNGFTGVYCEIHPIDKPGSEVSGTADFIFDKQTTFPLQSFGSFVPVLKAGTSPQPLNAAVSVGTYAITDGICTFTLRTLMNAAVVGTGNLSIEGLPVPANALTASSMSVWGGSLAGLTFSLGGTIAGSTRAITLTQGAATGFANLTQVNLTAATDIRVSGSYPL